MGKSTTDSAQRAPVRVLVVGPSLEILGGQAVQARRLLDRLQESDQLRVSFLPVNPRLPGVAGRLQSVKYVRTITTSMAYLVSLLRAVPKCDVVHAFSASYFSYLLAPLPAMIVARLLGKATLLNYHSGEADDHLTHWRWSARPTMRRLADSIVTPSAYLVEVFARHGLPATAISNFVPIDQLPYRRRSHISPNFLSNRNLEPLYDVAVLIRAFAIVQSQFPSATLTVAGDGSMREELERLVATLALNNVQFIGRVPPEEMGRLYDSADIYLNSPNIDNMPLSIVEAFACGIPVVTTDAGGIPFILENGRTGLSVRVGDHEGLAAAAFRLLQEHGLSLTLTEAARLECEKNYVWGAVRTQWESLYRELGQPR